MDVKQAPSAEVGEDLLEAIRSFPLRREVEHCGSRFDVAPFDFYATCPHCGERLKLRSFSAANEVEDVFDAVLEWMNRPGATATAQARQAALAGED